MSIDQKEELIEGLCEQYGLECSYSWGRFHIWGMGQCYRVVVDDFNHVDLSLWSAEQIEERVVGWALESGVCHNGR
jgi:hypothetical protein